MHNTLIDKAKEKKDGVYSYKGYLYAVRNNIVMAYADCFGTINSIYGAFHTKIGKVERYDRKKKLLEYLKTIN